jgi:hypothetical protein
MRTAANKNRTLTNLNQQIKEIACEHFSDYFHRPSIGAITKKLPVRSVQGQSGNLEHPMIWNLPDLRLVSVKEFYFN